MSLILKSQSESGLKSAMFSEIEKQLKAIKEGSSIAKRVILVVPAQSTLQTEEEAFDAIRSEGFMDLQIMSGSKLKTIILSETGSPDRTVVNTLGRTMLLRKIIKENRPGLKAFNKVSDQKGFLSLAADFIVLSKQNQVSMEELDALSKSGNFDELLSGKLSDMSVLMNEYNLAMEGKYTDSEDLWARTVDSAAESSYIKESIVWYYGFYSFTNVEYSLIAQLNKYSSGFNIAILAGEDRYQRGNQTVSRLSELLQCKPSVLDAPATNRNVRIINCSSPYTQAETIAWDILRKKKSRVNYKDMMVLTEDLSGMGESLKRVFLSLRIPFFMDEKRGMQHSGIARLVSSFMEICAYGYSKERVLGLLSCGLLDVPEEDISAFDNYLKEFKRTYDKAFLEPFKYKNKSSEAFFDAAEKVRSEVQSLTELYVKQFNDVKTVKEKCTVLYNFASEGVCAPEMILKVSKDYEAEDYLDSGSENVQSWDFFVSLLDQMVELLGATEISSEEFTDILSSCFGDVKIGVLPQRGDAVAIGTVNRSCFGKLHSLYIAGVNDGILPSQGDSAGVLTDDEKEALQAQGIYISKTSKILQLEERFNIDRALDSDCEELILSYCNCDASGDDLRPSEIINEFPEVQEETDIEESESYTEFLQSSELMRFKLPEILRNAMSGEDMPEEWKLAYNIKKDTPAVKAITEGIFYKTGESELDPEQADELYKKGSKDYYSPTQLEQYSSCPFKHFLGHGLRPLELKEFTVESRDAGTVYHEVFRAFAEKLCKDTEALGLNLNDPRSPWNTITDGEIETEVKAIFAEEIKSGAFDGLPDSDEENKYSYKRLEQRAVFMAKYMVLQFRKGDIYSMKFETAFGDGYELPPIKLNTAYGEVHIAGHIDRTDTLKIADREYIKIIDYKSGPKEFDVDKALKGYDLQLFVYLEGAMGAEDKKAAGVFYYSLQDPSSEAAMADALADRISEDLEKKIEGHFTLNGVMVDTPEVIRAFDRDVDVNKPNSKVFKKSSIISEEEMERLRKGFRETLTDICTRLKSGEISPKPAIYNKENISCDFCKYKAICLKD